MRAWEIRQRVIRKLTRNYERQTKDLNKAVWDKTMSDVTEGFCTGPFFDSEQVSDILKTPAWLPMPRFPVQQRGKLRPVDGGSATGSHANAFAHMTEKLSVPSTDVIITIIPQLHRNLKNRLGG